MVSNQTWLVKISVKLSIFIHRNSSCKWTLISMKGRWFFFLRKVVSYLEQFVVLKDIEQHKKLAFPKRQGNQACWLRRSGHNFSIPPPSCSFLHLFSFLLEVAHSCNLLIIQIRCRDPWIVFAKKGCQRKSCEEEMEDWEKQQRTSTEFRTLQNAPWKRYKGKEKQEGGIFHKELKKGILLVTVRWV